MCRGLLSFPRAGRCRAIRASFMRRRGALQRPGLIIGTFAIVYGFARIFGEFFREPDPQLGFLWRGLTMGMLLSLPMIAAGLCFVVWALRRPRTSEVAL